MKKLLVVFFLTSVPFLMMAQFSISGTISDAKTNEALVGAHVSIKGTYKGVYSNQHGGFRFSNLKTGSYEIIVSYLGYESKTQKVEVKNNLSVNFSMYRKALMEDEVTISATRAGNDMPLTFKNLEKADIKQINLGQDIPFILDQTPSVVISSDAGAGIGYTGIRIRGTDITRINVTVDGVPLNDAESHGVFFVNMPDFASSVDNVQIQRGVGTSTNGAAAFGASINFQTSTLHELPYAESNNAFGSFNTFKNNICVGTGLIKNKFTFDARLSKLSSDGYIDRSFSDLKSFYVSGGYYGKRSILKLNILSGEEHTYQAWWGVPKVRLENDEAGMQRYLDDWLYTQEEYDHMISSDSRTYNYYTYENETDNYQQDHYQLHYSLNLTPYLNFNTAFHFTHGEGYYEQFKADEDFASYLLEDVIIGSDTITSTDLVRQKWLDNNFYGNTWSFQYDKRNIKAVLGGSWNRYEGDHYGKIIWAEYASNGAKDYEWYFNTGDKKDLNIYSKINYRLTGQINLYGDIQYRKINYDITGIHDDLRDLTMNRTYDFINPKLGAYYSINENQNAYVSFAMANREPSRSAFRDADANDNPVPEKLMDYEAGYRLLHQKFMLNANAFYMDYKDQLVLTGEINDVGAAILTNIPSSYRAGIELIAGLKLNDKLQWNANITYSQNKIKNFTEYVDDWDNGGQVVRELGTTNLAFSPDIIAGSKINYELFPNFSISLLSKYVSDQYIDNSSNEDIKLDAYFVNDLLLSYYFTTKLVPEVSLSLKINNILNEKYETYAWVYRYYIGGAYYTMDGYFPQAGTNFLMNLSLKF